MSTTQSNTNAQQPFTSLLMADPWTPGAEACYHSITASAEHSNVSPEELRLQNYRQSKTPVYAPRERPQALSLSVRNPKFGAAKYRGPVITFVVGTQNAESFTIHESLVAGQSEFVRLALKSDWQEAKSREIPLPDDDLRTFEIYQGWLYDRQIYTEHWIGSSGSDDEPDRLMEAWVLGDKLLDINFKNVIMDVLVNRLRDTEAFVSFRTLSEFIYTKTPDGSAPRRLLIDIFTRQGGSSWLDDVTSQLAETYAVDLLKDLSKRQFAQRALSASVSLTPAYLIREPHCAYHDHEKGKCFRAKFFD